MSKIADQVYNIAKPIIEANNLQLVEVDYLKEGDDWILRVFIENPEGELSLSHCETISRLLSQELDQIDPIEDSYVLEVSSPGIERPLKTETDFLNNIGKIIYVKTYAPFKGKKEFTGKLIGFENNKIKMEPEDDEGVIKIPFSKVAKSNLTIDF
ncbi:MAG: ribosome maturation factor RimP [Bacillota bacterium]